MQLESGRKVAHYRIVGALGAGGMGEVYLAEDTRLGRAVALKVLPSDLASHPERVERFRREARALAALDHPNIVTVHAVEEADGLHFLIMGFAPGRTLTDLIPHGGMERDQLIDLACQLAAALVAAHGSGVVHRDLKPGNIMVADDGRLRVLDFGLAKLGLPSGERSASHLPTETPTREGSIVGTLPYMSPEQIEGRPIDARTDIFSCGVVLYQMATGRLPFTGESGASLASAILRDDPLPPHRVRPEFPAGVGRIIMRCLRKDAGERFSDAGDLREALEALRIVTAASSRRLWTMTAVAAALLVVVLGVGGWWWNRQSRAALARTEGIAEVRRLADAGEILAAYRRAVEIEPLVPAESLEELWPTISDRITMRSSPSGAEVSLQPYTEPDDAWVSLGATPLEQVRAPAVALRLRFDKSGHAISYRIPFVAFSEELNVDLPRSEDLPDGMVHVEGGRAYGWLAGLDPFLGAELDGFELDRLEVTNEEYQKFLDGGGYDEPEYWQHAFVRDERPLSWKDAMASFIDSTGRPGPAIWEFGRYPDGEGAYPVGGVSWYEAAAYARWAGKELPTLFHWIHAAGTWHSAAITAVSRFGADRPAVAGTGGMGPYGTFDMAGNVREWCRNNSGRGRYILGGGWDDQEYMFRNASVRSPFDRSPQNGFRCARYPGDGSPSPQASRDVPLLARDYRSEPPVSDEIFAVYRETFSYDPLPLEPRIESVEEHEHWLRQRISFAGPSGGRMLVYLFLPRLASPPYQTIVYYPSTSSTLSSSIDSPFGQKEVNQFSFLMRAGRALAYPILKGIHERNEGLESTWPNESHRYAEYLTAWVKEFRRTIDYLETREDIDADALAYLGFSWGARYGAVIPAVDHRLQASVLISGGLVAARARPEVDQGTYVRRVTIPTLMINGRFDTTHPLEAAQKTMLDLLGTPEEHRKHVLYEGGHMPPRSACIRETLAWLDRYLGPVSP